MSTFPEPRLVAVVVTMQRPRELKRLLEALHAQTRPPDLVIVVENMPAPETGAVLAGFPGVRHLVSRRNLGGAGGFAYGIFAALADGADFVWLMDDDGVPAGADCSARLLRAALSEGADVVSPAIVDIEAPDRLAFPYFVGGRRLDLVSEIEGRPPIRQFAHLFNGALVDASAFGRFGVPDYRLFFRGDEVDFLHSVRRGGGTILTLTDVLFRHPSGVPDATPILGGRMHAVVPAGDFKQFYFFRNRGYLLRRHRLASQLLSDLVRYPWFYLIKRGGDWAGLKRWAGLCWRGVRGDFSPFRSGGAKER